MNRVTLFIGLRGSLADDRTARILHVLLATLAVWLAAEWVATIPFAPKSFPRYFNTVVLEASYVTALVLLRLGRGANSHKAAEQHNDPDRQDGQRAKRDMELAAVSRR